MIFCVFYFQLLTLEYKLVLIANLLLLVPNFPTSNFHNSLYMKISWGSQRISWRSLAVWFSHHKMLPWTQSLTRFWKTLHFWEKFPGGTFSFWCTQTIFKSFKIFSTSTRQIQVDVNEVLVVLYIDCTKMGVLSQPDVHPVSCLYHPCWRYQGQPAAGVFVLM